MDSGNLGSTVSGNELMRESWRGRVQESVIQGVSLIGD